MTFLIFLLKFRVFKHQTPPTCSYGLARVLCTVATNVQLYPETYLLHMKYITLVTVFSYNLERGTECGCGNRDQTVMKLDASCNLLTSFTLSSY